MEAAQTAGSAVPLQLSLGLLPADSAAASCLFATDLSENRKAKEALEEVGKHFRELADAVPQIVWTASADERMSASITIISGGMNMLA